jgi:hypothetical protein
MTTIFISSLHALSMTSVWVDSARKLAERPCGTLGLLLSAPWKSVQKGGDPPAVLAADGRAAADDPCAINGLPEALVSG